MAQKQTASLGIQMFNHLEALSNALLRLNLPLEFRICCLKLLQNDLFCFYCLSGFLSYDDVSINNDCSKAKSATYHPTYQPIQGLKPTL